MAKANPVEAEIDRILREWRAEDDDEAAHIRRQILSVMYPYLYPGGFVKKLLAEAIHNARQALKNLRRDGG